MIILFLFFHYLYSLPPCITCALVVEYKDTHDLVGIEITTSKFYGKNFLWEKSASLSWCKRQIEDRYLKPTSTERRLKNENENETTIW